MLLQLALDKPEHFAVLSAVGDLVDIVEVGTPVLKRFGVSAIATARELTEQVPVLADTKTVDGGGLEAHLVFGAGAMMMTVLSVASPATHAVVGATAAEYGGCVVVDTITESGKHELLPADASYPDSYGYVAVHAPTDMREAGTPITSHIAAVRDIRARGHRVSLAGGIGPDTLDAVLAVEPEILVVGSAITEAPNPREVAQWIRERLTSPGRGWPWDES
jgi:3-hexulose-6-phosphate synthase